MTGPNIWLGQYDGHAAATCCGAVLETAGALANDAAAHARWRELVLRMGAALGWPAPAPVIRGRTGVTILAFHAPLDQLMLATDINEWAWELACGVQAHAGLHTQHPHLPDFAAALAWFAGQAAQQANPPLLALAAAAREHQLPLLLDDTALSLGTGRGGRSWVLPDLPLVDSVPWSALAAVPAVMVSGTNGKTTSVRLLAAMARQAGQRVGYCCTDGVVIDGAQIEAGDFSGPAGARAVLRQPNIDFAVLEVARGGILRRGLALERAQVALLTNVSPEHFGEYGIDSIEDLAEVKLVLAQALGPKGTLVLNADDALLLEFANRAASQLTCQIALFALDYAHPALQAQRARGAACCGVQNGHLLLYWGQQEYDLGLVVAMPLTVGGSAGYNIANCAGAALSAVAAGIAIADIAQVLVQFGASRHDNPGRLERWDLPDLTVLMDYAHNPEGLAGLMTVAQSLLQQRQQNAESAVAGRIGLLLGQAGNRSNEAIADLAQAAASFAPAHIVLKDITGYMRGRMAGEVPQLLQAQLLVCGMDASQIELILPEVEAAQALLRWAKAGDVLVLPVHDQSSKQAMQATLDALQASGWHAGQTLPALVAEEYSQGNTP